MILKLLSPEQQEMRGNMSRDLVNMADEEDSFLKKIVTSDEEWCILNYTQAIPLYGLVESFFKNEGHNVTVNGDRYRAMITNFFIPELNNHDVQELWFQQDGATCHTARATIDLLKDTFGDRLISHFGPVNWPPRSCDLTPLDYFLWSYVKSLVYADKPQTLDHLEDNVLRVIADIRPQMLEKSSKIGRPDWTTSEPAVAVLCQK
ncbi:putative transposable element [Trichonephila clavipes]|nr:putative transposable element [Trichonephila clavipes]